MRFRPRVEVVEDDADDFLLAAAAVDFEEDSPVLLLPDPLPDGTRNLSNVNKFLRYCTFAKAEMSGTALEFDEEKDAEEDDSRLSNVAPKGSTIT